MVGSSSRQSNDGKTTNMGISKACLDDAEEDDFFSLTILRHQSSPTAQSVIVRTVHDFQLDDSA